LSALAHRSGAVAITATPPPATRSLGQTGPPGLVDRVGHGRTVAPEARGGRPLDPPGRRARRSVQTARAWATLGACLEHSPASPEHLRKTLMQYRHLGRSGLQVSVLSLGSWVTYHNQVDTHAATEMLAAAMDAGVNFFEQRRGLRQRAERSRDGSGVSCAEVAAGQLHRVDQVLLGLSREGRP